MQAADLKRWMEENGKTVIDVASLAKVSLNTVNSFLAGRRVRPVVAAAFERLVRESPGKDKGPPEAA